MKYKLINHPQYYFFVDLEAECPKGSWAIFPNTVNGEIENFEGCNPKKCEYDYAANGNSNLHIIAHLPKLNSPKLDGVDLLPELPSNEDDVVNLSKEYKQSLIKSGKELSYSLEGMYGYMVGYKAVKQSDKKYSEEDIRYAVQHIKNLLVIKSIDEVSEYEVIQHLQSLPTTSKALIDFEVEMEYDEKSKKLKSLHQSSLPYEFTLHKQPKVIDGVLQGKWVIGSPQT